jgi:hypothetical protein
MLVSVKFTLKSYHVAVTVVVCLSVTASTSRRLLACRFAVYFCLVLLVVNTIRTGTAHSCC